VAAVAIERPDGPLVEAMLDTGLEVVMVAPRQEQLGQDQRRDRPSCPRVMAGRSIGR
jgi:hypothetical protein